MNHFKCINDKVDEFYRCCFVPILNHVITGNGEGLSNEGEEAF